MDPKTNCGERFTGHGPEWRDANLSPEDARTLFAWADPPLPESWHGVFSRDDDSGSRVVVHEDPPPRRR